MICALIIYEQFLWFICLSISINFMGAHFILNHYTEACTGTRSINAQCQSMPITTVALIPIYSRSSYSSVILLCSPKNKYFKSILRHWEKPKNQLTFRHDL